MTLTVGIDLVLVSQVTESLTRFGDRYLRRIFTDGEIAYATSAPEHTSQRLAARFAAKEATIKALDLADAGIGWRQIEVRRRPSGACELRLHGDAAAAAGNRALALSLSHEGDYATAVVVAHTVEEKKPA